jgi:hypothetical protein
MLTERVPAEMLADKYYADQLVAGTRWALVDAEQHERALPRLSHLPALRTPQAS